MPGYSTGDQHTDNQCVELLKHVDKERIFVDTVSGKTEARSRPGYSKLYQYVKSNPGQSAGYTSMKFPVLAGRMQTPSGQY